MSDDERRPGDEGRRNERDDGSRNERGDGSRATNDAERREPLGDLTEEIEERRKRRASEEPFTDAFEDVSVESVDTDAVWEELGRADAEPTAEPIEADLDADLGDLDGRDVRVVDKRSFCQGCRYFADPPTVACSHDGTEIVELVDADHFRVADCPMVAEAEQLTDELGSDES